MAPSLSNRSPWLNSHPQKNHADHTMLCIDNNMTLVSFENRTEEEFVQRTWSTRTLFVSCITLRSFSKQEVRSRECNSIIFSLQKFLFGLHWPILDAMELGFGRVPWPYWTLGTTPTGFLEDPFLPMTMKRIACCTVAIHFWRIGGTLIVLQRWPTLYVKRILRQLLQQIKYVFNRGLFQFGILYRSRCVLLYSLIGRFIT